MVTDHICGWQLSIGCHISHVIGWQFLHRLSHITYNWLPICPDCYSSHIISSSILHRSHNLEAKLSIDCHISHRIGCQFVHRLLQRCYSSHITAAELSNKLSHYLDYIVLDLSSKFNNSIYLYTHICHHLSQWHSRQFCQIINQ